MERRPGAYPMLSVFLGGGNMKKLHCGPWPVFFAALALGVLLHFLYGWLPNPLTALLSPVRESLWEHLKILFYPLLAAVLFLTRGDGPGRAARLLCLPLVCALMLGAGWAYHIALRGEGMAFDLVLYAALMALGFLLPRPLRPLGERAWVRSAASFLAVLVWVFLAWFTFFPPEHPLFADLSGGVRTFLTIPV